LIPKTIHQTISNKSSIHPELQENIRRLRTLNPDWDYCLYDDADRRKFIADEYELEMIQIYDRISTRYGAAKADFFRYLLLFRKGGVYLDIKSTALEPLSSVISEQTEYLISRWRNGPGEPDDGAGKHSKYGVDDELQQWFIVATQGHPFLRAVVDRVVRNILNYDALHGGVGASGVLRTTGPIAYTLAIQPILDQHAHQVVDIHTLGFRYSCLHSDGRQDLHRKIIPSYRDIRFPVVETERGDTFNVYAYYWLAVFIAYLHEVSKWGGVRQRLVDLKKRRRLTR